MKLRKKRVLSLLLVLLILFSSTCSNAAAVDDSSARASDYFVSYTANLSAPGSGQLLLSGRVRALSTMTSIGIAYFRVYLADGTFVVTIPGSTSNGLLLSNAISYNGSFTYQAVSGNRYYVVVTFICRNANGYEYRNYTTGTVTA